MERTPDGLQATQLGNSALLALIGGYLDGFTYVGHGHVFANAMTGNVVLLGVNLVTSSWHQGLRHLLPIITFFLGISAAKAVGLGAQRKVIRYPYLTVLAVEICVLLGLSFLPGTTPDFWITTSIAFASSMQVETFREVNGHAFNTTFTTGNLRTLSENLFDWFFAGHTEEARKRMWDFFVICLAFFLGAAAGGFGTLHLGNRALWVDVLLLVFVLLRLWPQRGQEAVHA